MARTQKFTAEQVVEALREAQGMQNLAAKILGCHRRTVARYAERYASVKEELEDQRGLFLDIAETQLREAVVEGDPWAIRFALQFLGKDRGYTEKKELDVKSETCVTIDWDE